MGKYKTKLKLALEQTKQNKHALDNPHNVCSAPLSSDCLIVCVSGMICGFERYVGTSRFVLCQALCMNWTSHSPPLVHRLGERDHWCWRVEGDACAKALQVGTSAMCCPKWISFLYWVKTVYMVLVLLLCPPPPRIFPNSSPLIHPCNFLHDIEEAIT